MNDANTETILATDLSVNDVFVSHDDDFHRVTAVIPQEEPGDLIHVHVEKGISGEEYWCEFTEDSFVTVIRP